MFTRENTTWQGPGSIPSSSTVAWMWIREVLLIVGGDGDVVRAPEQRELDICMGGQWEEVVEKLVEEVVELVVEVVKEVELVWEEVEGGRREACMPSDGLPQLRACSSHREQQVCYAIVENFLPIPSYWDV